MTGTDDDDDDDDDDREGGAHAMTAPTANGPDRSAGKQLRRYGPIAVVAIIVAVVVVAAAVGGGGDGDDADEAAGGGNGGDEVGAPEPTGEMPITYAEAEEQGAVHDYDWGDRCDTETGKLKMPTVYAYPCVPVFEGDNGGDTGPVSPPTRSPSSATRPDRADLQSLLAGANVDIDPADAEVTANEYLEIYASLAETYGREIELVTYEGTGASTDEVSSRADAREIADEIEPFAVIGGPSLDGGAFAQELANSGIICMACSQAMPDRVVQDNQPYIWGGQGPSVDQMLENLFARRPPRPRSRRRRPVAVSSWRSSPAPSGSASRSAPLA
ncbi:MAG: hypothetical protein U5R31_00350 [Acidimicrobiia bacterium]|nr:hypothetical protein [Acidimicrobiia bacterium]